MYINERDRSLYDSVIRTNVANEKDIVPLTPLGGSRATLSLCYASWLNPKTKEVLYYRGTLICMEFLHDRDSDRVVKSICRLQLISNSIQTSKATSLIDGVIRAPSSVIISLNVYRTLFSKFRSSHPSSRALVRRLPYFCARFHFRAFGLK